MDASLGARICRPSGFVIGCLHVSGLIVRRSHAAGRYGDTRIGSKSLRRARKAHCPVLVFPTPIWSIICRYGSSSSSHRRSQLGTVASADCALRNLVILIAGQHRPDGPGHLVSQCDRNQHLRLAGQHSRQPWPGLTAGPTAPTHHGYGPDNQKAANVALAHL